MFFGKNNKLTHRYFSDQSERVGLGYLSKNERIDFQNLRWPWYATVFILKGKGRYVDHNGKEHLLSAGMYFQRIPQLLHSTYIDTSEEWQELFFDFGVKTYEMMVACQMINPNKFVGYCKLSKGLQERHFQLTQKLQDCENQSLPRILPEVISLLQDCFAQTAKEGDSIVQEASHYLRKNFLVSDKIQFFCQERAIGYESLRKKFKEEMNCTPRQYQNLFRMEKAVKLLTQTQLSIEQVSDQLKYCNAFEFSKQFKKFQGISPSQSRN
jgi:AraC family transcriptional regulator, arabinose operon regulatory protein